MSMGSLLLTGGAKGKRLALPNSRILIHQPSAGFEGSPPTSRSTPARSSRRARGSTRSTPSTPASRSKQVHRHGARPLLQGRRGRRVRPDRPVIAYALSAASLSSRLARPRMRLPALGGRGSALRSRSLDAPAAGVGVVELEERAGVTLAGLDVRCSSGVGVTAALFAALRGSTSAPRGRSRGGELSQSSSVPGASEVVCARTSAGGAGDVRSETPSWSTGVPPMRSWRRERADAGADLSVPRERVDGGVRSAGAAVDVLSAGAAHLASSHAATDPRRADARRGDPRVAHGRAARLEQLLFRRSGARSRRAARSRSSRRRRTRGTARVQRHADARGVPVRMRSPGSSVLVSERNPTSARRPEDQVVGASVLAQLAVDPRPQGAAPRARAPRRPW